MREYVLPEWELETLFMALCFCEELFTESKGEINPLFEETNPEIALQFGEQQLLIASLKERLNELRFGSYLMIEYNT